MPDSVDIPAPVNTHSRGCPNTKSRRRPRSAVEIGGAGGTMSVLSWIMKPLPPLPPPPPLLRRLGKLNVPALYAHIRCRLSGLCSLLSLRHTHGALPFNRFKFNTALLLVTAVRLLPPPPPLPLLRLAICCDTQLQRRSGCNASILVQICIARCRCYRREPATTDDRRARVDPRGYRAE